MAKSGNIDTKLMVSGVMVATIIGKLLGFLKELILAHFFGAGSVSDAYIISQTIPGTLFMVIGTGITTCFVPTYIKKRSVIGRKKSDKFTDNFITIIVLVTLLLTLLLEIAPNLFVKVFAIGFDNYTFSLACEFTRINGSSLVLAGFLYCYSALLQSENKYHHVAISIIPYNIGLLFAVVLGAYINIYALSVVSVIAIAFQLGYQRIFVRRIPYHYHPYINLRDSDLKDSLSLLPPVILGVAAAEINTLIDRTLASSILIGGITVITYGTSLFNLVNGVFSHAVSAIYYPKIAESVAKNDKYQFSKNVNDAVFLALYFLLPCTVGSIVLRTPIVMLLFGHGEFGASHVTTLSHVFACYSIGFLPFSINQVLNNVYYSHQKTKTPMTNTIISVFINVILNFVFSRFFGLSGLAIATSLASIVVAIILIISCKKDYGLEIMEPRNFCMLLISTAIMGAICYFLQLFLGKTSFETILVVFAGGFSYFLVTVLLGISPIDLKDIKRRVFDDRFE